MKPLPDLNNDETMIQRGKLSVIASARKDAAETLRDACTAIQGAEWHELHKHAKQAQEASERLQTLAAMWGEVTG